MFDMEMTVCGGDDDGGGNSMQHDFCCAVVAVFDDLTDYVNMQNVQ